MTNSDFHDMNLVRTRCDSAVRRASRKPATEPVRRCRGRLVSAPAHRAMRWWHMERPTLGCMLVALSLVAGMPGTTHATESEGPCPDRGHPDFWRLNALAEVQRCLPADKAIVPAFGRRFDAAWSGSPGFLRSWSW